MGVDNHGTSEMPARTVGDNHGQTRWVLGTTPLRRQLEISFAVERVTVHDQHFFTSMSLRPNH